MTIQNPGYISLFAISLILPLSLCSPPGVFAHSSELTARELFVFNCTVTGNGSNQAKTCPMSETPSQLIQSADGNFYGTTESGGTGPSAAGTVFKLTPAGPLTTIYTFVADPNGNYRNGANPGGVVEGSDGFLYGSTIAGGADNSGVVFRLSKAGALHALHMGAISDLTFGRDGNLYGYGPDMSGNTAVVRITTSGSYQVLHTLEPKIDGIYAAGLILGSDGNLYGTTIDAEAAKITSLFRLTPSSQFTVLQTVHYGQFLTNAPIQSQDGNLYAALDFVVQNDGALPPGLLERDLSGAGFRPIALSYGVEQWMQELMEASDGNLWGTSSRIGQGGAIVSFTHDGAPLQQIDFGGYALMQASDGRIIGQNGNEIFALEPALPAPKPLFVVPGVPSGAVGLNLAIYGAHFIGTTRVSFNGVSAAFKVLNTGNILAAVPVGATTGPIEVTNAGGTSESAQSFVVE